MSVWILLYFFFSIHNVCVNSFKFLSSEPTMSAAARLLRLWFRIPREHGCLSVVSVVCCQVEVSTTSWSRVQRSLTDRDASLCVI
jgi:hypothetical protein